MRRNDLDRCRATGGTGYLVDDQQVFQMQQGLAREEGIFCEPAGAVALTGAAEAVRKGEISKDSRVVCLVTGSAFKDTGSLIRIASEELHPMVESVEQLAGLVC